LNVLPKISNGARNKDMEYQTEEYEGIQDAS
jgi:hypothetical protein